MWSFVASAENLQNPDWALRREILLTNGLGGYTATSVVGCNTRRYHGLLVAALKPPLERRVLLSHLDELLVMPDGAQHYLNTTEYRDGFYPDGFRRLIDFHYDPLPAWRWQVGEIVVTKRVLLPYRSNCVLVHYHFAGPTAGARFVIAPFVAMRDFHHLILRHDDLHVHPMDGVAGWRVPFEDDQQVFVQCERGEIAVEPVWYNRIYHRLETERGQDDVEDLLRLGSVTASLDESREFCLAAWLGDGHCPLTFAEGWRGELMRRRELIRQADPRDQREQALVVAADQFLVERKHGNKPLMTILAGYPWFADWGRDAMIALPGLTLATGRVDIARDVLQLFAGLVDEGMLPNRFEDDNAHLSYNTVDAALWFVQACNAFVRHTGDMDFLRDKLWKAIAEILNAYHRGTRHNIGVDDDGLLHAGDASTQLTWMDAKQGDVVFTPRHGKAVEINSLWISALHLAADWAASLEKRPPTPVKWRDKVADAFRAAFWNPQANCLYDCIAPDGRPDPAIRPNQLFAVSLPQGPLTGEDVREQALAVVDVARKKLVTPCGLRSLAPDDPNYHPRYEGGWFDRDSAYHQGTVWTWLTGPYVDALMASSGGSSGARAEAQQVVDSVLGTLDQGTLGTLAEIFDGNAPHLDRGCFAQAWSVAEVLRVKRAYEL